MTPILLDTHVLLWLMDGNRRLAPRCRRAIEAAAKRDSLLVSAITPWEIAMLVAKRRLRLAQDVQTWIDAVLRHPGVQLVPLMPEIAVKSTQLPWEIHADPADRILVATARHLGATLATADESLLRYGAEGHYRCLGALVEG